MYVFVIYIYIYIYIYIFIYTFIYLYIYIFIYMPCGVGHKTKNSTNVFSACRKRRLKETGRGDWESPPL